MKLALRRMPGSLLCALLAACAAGGVNPVPERLQRSIEENNRAEQFYARGDYRAAHDHYQKALLEAQSVEDEDAIAANLVNLSVVHQRLGEGAAAIDAVERVLNERNLRYPELRLAEAALRRALLAMEAGDAKDARRRIDQAEEWCRAPCKLNGKILSLRGYLAVAEGDAAGAGQLALRAVQVHRDSGDREELANSLRLVGLAALSQGEAGRALAPLADALAIDKQLAAARAIANDLIALGRAHAGAGNSGQARAHYQRALAAALADGNQPAMAQARQGLSMLEQSGPVR